MSSERIVDGYRISCEKGEFVIVPRGNRWAIEVDDLTISGDGNSVCVSPAVGLAEICVSSQGVADPDEMTSEDVFVRNGKTCIHCEGKRYCASNGCIKTPCGWLCG